MNTGFELPPEGQWLDAVCCKVGRGHVDPLMYFEFNVSNGHEQVLVRKHFNAHSKRGSRTAAKLTRDLGGEVYRDGKIDVSGCIGTECRVWLEHKASNNGTVAVVKAVRPTVWSKDHMDSLGKVPDAVLAEKIGISLAGEPQPTTCPICGESLDPVNDILPSTGRVGCWRGHWST